MFPGTYIHELYFDLMFIAISKVDIGINFTELRGALMIIVITLIIIIIIPLTEVNLLETITLTLI